MVCTNCLDLRPFPDHDEDAADANWQKLYLDVSVFEQSAATCVFCQIALATFEHLRPNAVSVYDEWIHQAKFCNGAEWKEAEVQRYGVIFVVDYDDEQKPFGQEIFVFRNLLGDHDGKRNDVFADSEYPSTGSESAVTWTKRQIQDCRDNHPACKASKQTPLPKRVLKLSPENFGNTGITLYESVGEHSTYATLSHCWGKERPLRLQQNNIAALQSGISIQSLPLTFQHAVSFTLQLGIEFLWIDSLCIVQDSEEDWLSESANMANIYKNSVITLAATVASDGSKGCFREQSMSIRGCVTNGKVTAAIGETETINKLRDGSRLTDPLVYLRRIPRHGGRDRLSSMPLLERAWVYQERILSPRVLHFTNLELIWECSHQTICFCGQQEERYDEFGTFCPPKQYHVHCLRNDSDPTLLARRWYTMVSQYTKLKLSIATDRAAAIAGLAKHYGQTLGSSAYLAGVWKDQLVPSLTWYSWYPTHAPTIPLAAPSWSWISYPGTADYTLLLNPDMLLENMPVVKHVTVENDSPDHFLNFGNISVMLHGEICSVLLWSCPSKHRLESAYFMTRPEKLDYDPVHLDYLPNNGELDSEWTTNLTEDDFMGKHIDIVAGRTICDVRDWYDECPNIAQPYHLCKREVFSLYLGMMYEDSNSYKSTSLRSSQWETFLLLEYDTARKGYRRLGISISEKRGHFIHIGVETQDVSLI